MAAYTCYTSTNDFLRVPGAQAAAVTSPTPSSATSSYSYSSKFDGLSKASSATELSSFTSAESIFDLSTDNRNPENFTTHGAAISGDSLDGAVDALRERLAKNPTEKGERALRIMNRLGLGKMGTGMGDAELLPFATVDSEEDEDVEDYDDAFDFGSEEDIEIRAPQAAADIASEASFSPDKHAEQVDPLADLSGDTSLSVYSGTPSSSIFQRHFESPIQPLTLSAWPSHSAIAPLGALWQCHIISQSTGSISRIIMSPLNVDDGALAVSSPAVLNRRSIHFCPPPTSPRSRPLHGLAIAGPDLDGIPPTPVVFPVESGEFLNSSISCLSIGELACYIAPKEESQIVVASSSSYPDFFLAPISPEPRSPPAFHSLASSQSLCVEAADSPRRILDPISPCPSRRRNITFDLLKGTYMLENISEEEEEEEEEKGDVHLVKAGSALVGLGLGDAAVVLFQTSWHVSQDVVGQEADSGLGMLGAFQSTSSDSISASSSPAVSPKCFRSIAASKTPESIDLSPSISVRCFRSIARSITPILTVQAFRVHPDIRSNSCEIEHISLFLNQSPPSSNDCFVDTLAHLPGSDSARSITSSKSLEGLGIGLPSSLASRPARPRDVSSHGSEDSDGPKSMLSTADECLDLAQLASAQSPTSTSPAKPLPSQRSDNNTTRPFWKLRKFVQRQLSDIPELPTPSPEAESSPQQSLSRMRLFSRWSRSSSDPHSVLTPREMETCPSIGAVLSAASTPPVVDANANANASSSLGQRISSFFSRFSRSGSSAAASSPTSPDDASPQGVTSPTMVEHADIPRGLGLFSRRGVASSAPRSSKPVALATRPSRPISFLF